MQNLPEQNARLFYEASFNTDYFMVPPVACRQFGSGDS